MYMKTVLTNLLLVLSIILIVVGLKFTSIGSGPGNVQNDGFNVTGGFMTLFGGFILGYIINNKIRNKK